MLRHNNNAPTDTHNHIKCIFLNCETLSRQHTPYACTGRMSATTRSRLMSRQGHGHCHMMSDRGRELVTEQTNGSHCQHTSHKQQHLLHRFPSHTQTLRVKTKQRLHEMYFNEDSSTFILPLTWRQFHAVTRARW